MNDAELNNVVLLPQTVDFYQVEITQLLESERYIEAIDLLNFLLNCQPVDPQTFDEWQHLLEWLQNNIMHERMGPMLDQDDLTETELHKQHLRLKTELDSGYTQKLLDMLTQQHHLEKQLIALEQLTYIEQDEIDQILIQWLKGPKLHPSLQFKGLQALKIRGMSGTIKIIKNGQPIIVEVGETPVSLEHFPEPISDILRIFMENSETETPDLINFAQPLWYEFLAVVYATPTYGRLLDSSPTTALTWAAALHTVVQEMLHGNTDYRKMLEVYDQEGNSDDYEQACAMLRTFMGLLRGS